VNDVAQFTSLLLFKNAVISNDVNDFVIQPIKTKKFATLDSAGPGFKLQTSCTQDKRVHFTMIAAIDLHLNFEKQLQLSKKTIPLL